VRGEWVPFGFACAVITLGCGRTALEPLGGDASSLPTAAQDAAAYLGPDGFGDTGGAGGEAGPDSAVEPVSIADFTTFLANPQHTDFVEDTALVPPLSRAWSIQFDGPVSYPLVVGGFVYVTRGGTTSGGTTTDGHLFALDAVTGSTVWSADLGETYGANLAYDGGRVFTVNTGVPGMSTLRAFDAMTGALDWEVAADPNQSVYEDPPVAFGGMLYVTGAGVRGTLYAYDESTGALSWQRLTDDAAAGSPAVSAEGVFIFESCGWTNAFSLTGITLWTYPTPRGDCMTGANTPVLFGHGLYETLPQGTNALVDVRTGGSMGTFASDASPAFGDGVEVDVLVQTIRGTSMASGASLWTFTPDRQVALAPLVVPGTVFVASSIGTLYALDAATGNVTWSDATNGDFTSPPFGAPLGMGAAHGHLVVPVGDELVAYASAGSSYDAGLRVYRASDGAASCRWTLVDGPPPPMAAHIPVAMAVADLDADGKADIVTVGSYSGSTVDVMLGDGDGTFRALPEVGSFSNGTNAVAVADVDGDGKLDVVAASTYQSDDSPENVNVYRGNGDGTLQTPSLYGVGGSPHAIALADLDDDRHPDLLVADGNDGLCVALNRGDGTFAPPVTYGDEQLVSLAVGDANGDGKPDVAVAVYYPPSLEIRFGAGDGTFGAPQSIGLDAAPTVVAFGDLDGDGKLDIVILTTEVDVLLGNGDGTFEQPEHFGANLSPSGVAVADIDGDGHLDLAVTDIKGGSVSILFGNGDGTFQEQGTFATGAGPLSPAVADFNDDGRPDVVTCDDDADSVSLFLGACTGTDR